jgi:uncharacterized phage protein (TIGR02218 family)
MKACSSGLNTHIQQGQTTLATLLKVTRICDGQVFGFTNHDLNLIFGGVTYLATTSFNPFNQNQKYTGESATTEMTGAFDAIITRADVLADLWDGATFQVLRVNWMNLSQGAIIMLTGTFGEFEPQEFGFRVALHDLLYALTFIGGDLCQPGCRVDFGSTLCAPGGVLANGTDINTLLQSLTVLTTDGSRVMTVSGLTNTGKPFDGGLVTFLGSGSPASGPNANLSAEVIHVDFSTGTITLRPCTLIAPIQVGDTLKIRPACDKLFGTCSIVWLNAVNNQAEPHAPSPSNVLANPDYVAPSAHPQQGVGPGG